MLDSVSDSQRIPRLTCDEGVGAWYLDALKEAVINGDAKGCTVLTEVAIQGGSLATEGPHEAWVPAIRSWATSFRCNEVYVPEVSGGCAAMKKSLGLLKPLLTQTGAKARRDGGDRNGQGRPPRHRQEPRRHDAGGGRFEVVDLGADVARRSSCRSPKTPRAQIVGISTCSRRPARMKDVLRALERADLRTKVKVMVGGAPVTQSFADEIGADGYGESAAEAVDKAKELLGSSSIGSTVRQFEGEGHDPRERVLTSLKRQQPTGCPWTSAGTLASTLNSTPYAA